VSVSVFVIDGFVWFLCLNLVCFDLDHDLCVFLFVEREIRGEKENLEKDLLICCVCLHLS